jgi:hypothetical protein
MKLSANITLIYQAMERQAAAAEVYVAIPRPKNMRAAAFRSLRKLLKRLEIGLILVTLDSAVSRAEIDIFADAKPRDNKKTETIRHEVLRRTADSTGGTNKGKINTAYRERCIQIACLLEANGAMTGKDLVAQGCEKGANNILRANYYGWFEKREKAVYMLTELGKSYLEENKTEPLVAYYRMKTLAIL